MIKEDFYATIKLKNGEEIFSKVLPTEENDQILLLMANPITVSEIKNRNGMSGYKIESWLKTTKEDFFILNMNDILIISESKDDDMISLYNSYVEKMNKPQYINDEKPISRRMGYISNVNDAKRLLEKLYKNS